MKLRYLVPALGVLASTNFVAAETVGGLTIGGYVDVVSSIEHVSEADPDANGNNSTYGTSAATELRVGYKVGDAVTTQIDIEANNNDSTGAHGDFYLEQAYINWALSDQFSLTAGKYTTYSGWVAADADGLYRINGAAVVPLAYGSEIIGVAGNFTASESFAISVFLVNGLSVIEGNEFNGNTDSNFALGVDATLSIADVGSVNFEAGYDYIGDDGAAADENSTAELSLAVNTTLNFASYEPLTLAGEIMFRNISDYSADYGFGVGAGAAADGIDSSYMLFQVLANHTIPASIPMSVTGQILYASTKIEAAGGDVSPSAMEIAVALLTNPTGDSNFGLNFEVYYGSVDTDTTGADNVDSVGLAVELLALIP